MLLGENFDLLASAKSGGGSSSYYADAEYCNDTGQLCLVGGDASSGLPCGLACVLSYDAFSRAIASLGSRLAYRTSELAKYSGKQFCEIWKDMIFEKR
jgi:hypothetical protein